MWGQPKRNSKNRTCSHGRGQCSCQRRDNAVARRFPEAAPRTCTTMCQPGRGACGKTRRGDVCPCPYC